MFNPRIYNIWLNIYNRCYCPNNPYFKYYGARGIDICAEWYWSYDAFQDWALANGYQDDLEIDRIKNHLGYSPDNCRWVTHQQNMINRRKQKGTSSVFRGVSWSIRGWRARIKIDGIESHLGYFDYELWAALAYDDAAHEAFKEFAQPNFPERIRKVYHVV